MNGLLKRSDTLVEKRPGSPTTSDSSKENMEEEDNNNMSGLTRSAFLRFYNIIHGKPFF